MLPEESYLDAKVFANKCGVQARLCIGVISNGFIGMVEVEGPKWVRLWVLLASRVHAIDEEVKSFYSFYSW